LDKKKIKFGIVGLGNIGSRHLAVTLADPDAHVVAICDIDKSKIKKYSDLYGGLVCYDDYHKLLDHPGLDIISICTPHGLHAEMSIAAAKKRKHVLVEKPMAIATEAANRMIKAAQEHGVKLLVVKQNRYNVPVVLTKKALTESRLGRIFMVQCNVLWNRYEGYYSESNWRGKKSQEGGALYTQASHFIDLLIWWFGDVIEAKTKIETKNHSIEIEDCGTSLLTFDSGVLGTLVWTTCVYNANYEGSITIIGEYGTIKIGGQYLNKIEYWDVKDFPIAEGIEFADKPNSYGKYQGTSSNHDKVIKDVIALLLNEKHNTVEGTEGYRSINAIEMIYKSL